MLEEIYSQRQSQNSYVRPAWFHSPGRINYEDIKDVSDEEILAVFAKFDETEKHNNTVARHNRELAATAREAFIADLKSIGINPFGVRGGLNKPYSDTIREIEYAITGRSHPAKPSPYFYYNNEEVKVYNGSIGERVVRFKSMVEVIKERELKKDRLYRASCEYIVKHGLEIPESTDSQQLMAIVREHAESAFVAENYPNGTELEAADCDYCDTWVVGERRCSCGNRRQYLEVEGNILDGFYAYPQAY